MKKSKVLSLLAIVFGLLNIALLVFIFSRPKPPKHLLGPKNEIVELLHFDENQAKDFANLIEKHRDKILIQNNQIIAAKKVLYSHLSDENPHQNKDSLVQIIMKKQREIENLHFQHFIDIKGLCKESQLADFETFSLNITELFNKRPPMQKKP